jgi:hypothetical protein
MIPQHIYDAIIESPAGKLIDRLISEEHARGGNTSTPGGNGSIIDQLYDVVTTAQKKYRRDRVKASRQGKLKEYQVIALEQALKWQADD